MLRDLIGELELEKGQKQESEYLYCVIQKVQGING